MAVPTLGFRCCLFLPFKSPYGDAAVDAAYVLPIDLKPLVDSIDAPYNDTPYVDPRIISLGEHADSIIKCLNIIEPATPCPPGILPAYVSVPKKSYKQVTVWVGETRYREWMWVKE
jgi:hypothetical protein